MSIYSDFSGELSLELFTAIAIDRVSAELADNPLAVRRHAERMYVGLGYVCDYLRQQYAGPYQVCDVLYLNSDAVARTVESELGPEGLAGIARTVALFIQQAQTFVEESAQTRPNRQAPRPITVLTFPAGAMMTRRPRVRPFRLRRMRQARRRKLVA